MGEREKNICGTQFDDWREKHLWQRRRRDIRDLRAPGARMKKSRETSDPSRQENRE